MRELQRRVCELEAAGADPARVLGLIGETAHPLVELIGRASPVDPRVAVWLTSVVRELFLCEALLSGRDSMPLAPRGFDGEISPDSHPKYPRRRVALPTDLLYALHSATMPPERMAIVAGRRDSDTVMIGAAWDVTGACTAGHCRADPAKLPQALSCIGSAGCYMALWLHSHPGEGADWTRPSSIDLRQHQDWIADYSPYLISAIAARDGFIRLWGTAVAGGLVDIELVGTGVARLPTADDTVLLRLTDGG